MKKPFQKIVDERQEKVLRAIESTAFWMMFWCLSCSILIQLFAFHARLPQLAGELITLSIGSITAITAYVKTGEWSYFSNPSWKSYLSTGLVLALMAAVILPFMVKTENQFFIVAAGIVLAFLFGFSLTAGLGAVVKKKRSQMEKDLDSDSDSESV